MDITNAYANGADPAALESACAREASERRGAARILLDDPETREQVRYLVEETNVTLAAIARQFAVPRTSLGHAVRERSWKRPDKAAAKPKPEDAAPRPSPKQLARSLGDFDRVAGRLLRAVDRQIGLIERRLRTGQPSVDEKDARTLGALAKALETVHGLDRQRDKDRPDEPGTIDRTALRADLARRIAAWAEGADDPDPGGG